MNELFDKYVPDCILEMRRAYSHITPLGKWQEQCLGAHRSA